MQHETLPGRLPVLLVWIVKRLMSAGALSVLHVAVRKKKKLKERMSFVAISFDTLSPLFHPCRFSEIILAGPLTCRLKVTSWHGCSAVCLLWMSEMWLFFYHYCCAKIFTHPCKYSTVTLSRYIGAGDFRALLNSEEIPNDYNVKKSLNLWWPQYYLIASWARAV